MTPARRAQWGWALYDCANSAFATTVLAGFFPIFFRSYWNAGVPDDVVTFRLGLAHSASGAFILVLAPLLGALADRGGAKKAFLFAFALLGAAATALLATAPANAWLVATTLFALASIGFSGSIVFYDALLVDVAGPREYERVSALGYGLGYLGGGVLFALNVAMVLKPALFGLDGKTGAVQWSFVMVGLWWALFTLPLMRMVPAPSIPPRPPGSLLSASLRQLGATFSTLRQHRPIWLFLFAYWLYIDGVDTVIRMAVNFGQTLGFPDDSLIVALLIVQFVGFPAAIAFGRIGERFGPRNAVLLALAVYIGVTLWATTLTTVAQFYGMAMVIALVQGGVQSQSRALFAQLIPSGRAGEFFGFYNMLGKFAVIFGPLLVGWAALVVADPRHSLLALLALFVPGALLLARVPVSLGR
ncbi:MAG TPA: MFS transporter [Verrucomicrobiae bacterium]|nr:MFS transporter [Verrucomicrobiae bacterium]